MLALCFQVLGSWVGARQQLRHSLFPTRILHGFGRMRDPSSASGRYIYTVSSCFFASRGRPSNFLIIASVRRYPSRTIPSASYTASHTELRAVHPTNPLDAISFDRGHGILAHASSDQPRAPADEHATADSPWPNCEEARETPTHKPLSQSLSLSWLACASQYTACACSGAVRDMGATSRVRREGEGGRGRETSQRGSCCRPWPAQPRACALVCKLPLLTP